MANGPHYLGIHYLGIGRTEEPQVFPWDSGLPYKLVILKTREFVESY